MGYLVQQSSTTRPLLFLLVQSSDHITGLTGATPTVTISKNGATFAAPAGAVTEVGNGWYKVAGNATDNATLGPLLLHATAASADPCDDRFEVVAFNPDNATNLGLADLDAAVSSRMATFTLPTNFSAMSITAAGKVAATLASTDVSGNVAADVQTIKTQTVTCGAGVTVGAYVGNATAPLTVSASGDVTVGGYAASEDPATLVLGATATSWDTAGTIGQKINAAGGASDPLTNAVPGAYAAGTAGYVLGTNLDAKVSAIPTNPLTTLGTNAPAGWIDIDAFSIDAWQVQTRRIDVTGTTTPSTADTYISYGYHNDRTYFKSTTLGTTIYLWYDSVGTQWVLSEAVGTNGTSYFISTGTIFFDGNFIAQGTATGTPVAAAHGGSMLSAQQYPTTFESLTIQGAATFSGGVVVNPTTLNTAAVQLTGNGAGPAVSMTSGNIASAVVRLTGNGTNTHGIQIIPTGTGVGINGTLATVTNLTNAATAGDFTATMKASLDAATPASVTGAVGSVTGNVGGNVSGSVASVTNTVNATLVSTGLDAITTTEHVGAPSTFAQWVMALARRFLNKTTMPDTIGSSGTDKLTVYGADGTTVLTTQTVTDDGTTQTQGAAS